MRRCLPERHHRSRNSRTEETSRRQRKMEVSSEETRAQRGLQRRRWMDELRPRHVSYYFISQARISLPISYVVPSAYGISRSYMIFTTHRMLFG